jgi:hypothetical protein
MSELRMEQNVMEELRIKLKFKALLVSIYIFPWISQYIARVTGIQMFTLAVAIMGSYQIFLVSTYSKTPPLRGRMDR